MHRQAIGAKKRIAFLSKELKKKVPKWMQRNLSKATWHLERRCSWECILYSRKFQQPAHEHAKISQDRGIIEKLLPLCDAREARIEVLLLDCDFQRATIPSKKI